MKFKNVSVQISLADESFLFILYFLYFFFAGEIWKIGNWEKKIITICLNQSL